MSRTHGHHGGQTPTPSASQCLSGTLCLEPLPCGILLVPSLSRAERRSLRPRTPVQLSSRAAGQNHVTPHEPESGHEELGAARRSASSLALLAPPQRIPRCPLRRAPRRAFKRGARRAGWAVLHPRRVERRAPAAALMINLNQVLFNEIEPTDLSSDVVKASRGIEYDLRHDLVVTI